MKETSSHKKGKEFSIWAKTQKLRKGLTTLQIAEAIGYSTRATSEALNGSIKLPYVTIALAKFFNHDAKTDCSIPVSPARPETRSRTSA